MPRKARPWFRKSDGWWYIKIGGQPTKLARGRDKQRLAIERWHELMAERAHNPPVDSPQHTVASVIDLYLSHIQGRRAKRTYDACFAYLQRFAEAHGFRPIANCRPIHLTTWLDANPRWKADWTLHGVVSIVHRPFNWATRQGVIDRNPFRGVRHRPGEPRRPITDAEFWGLLRATAPRRPSDRPRSKKRQRPTPGERFRQVLFFLRYTGTRPSEMAVLNWDDIHLDRRVIILRHHKTSRMQRQPRPRVIPLVPLVVKLLIRIKRQQPRNNKRVFLTSRGTCWNRNNLSLRMRRLRKKANLPDDVVLYGIRHRFGTQSIVNGVQLKTLAELMGHTTTRMTEHYVHLGGQDSHLAAAMQQAVSRRQDT